MPFGRPVLSFSVSVLIRIGDKSEKKPVFQVELVPEEQLVVFISGKFLYPHKLCGGKGYTVFISVRLCVFIHDILVSSLLFSGLIHKICHTHIQSKCFRHTVSAAFLLKPLSDYEKLFHMHVHIIETVCRSGTVCLFLFCRQLAFEILERLS